MVAAAAAAAAEIAVTDVRAVAFAVRLILFKLSDLQLSSVEPPAMSSFSSWRRDAHVPEGKCVRPSSRPPAPCTCAL